MNMRKFTSFILAMMIAFGCIVMPSSAVVTSSDYTAEELQCSSYDVRKYTDPFWEGNIVYNEIVHPIKNESEELVPFELMYDASEIVSVKNYTLTVTYRENVDYILQDGNLVILPTGSIPVMDYIYMHPLTASAGYTDADIYPYYPHADGVGYEYWLESAEICRYSLAVTYIHNDTWEAPVPESQETELPNTFEKLKNDDDLTIVVAGDSVASGALSSEYLNISPMAPAYPEMTLEALRQKYSNNNIRLVNSAIGGTISTYDATKVNNSITNHYPDLVIINFGMNDSSFNRVGLDGSVFRANIVKHIEHIKEKLPECEILLVPSLYGNRYTFPAEKYEEHGGILHDLAEEYDGVGVADPQMIEKYLIEEIGKDYICFTADNMVHPGDLGMRLYTQAILEALSFDDISTYRTYVIEKMTKYVSDNNIDVNKSAELAAKINETASVIADLTDEWDINAVIDGTYPEIDAILSRCDSHIYSDTVVPPTCKEGGYTVSVCMICGDGYTHSPTDSLNRAHIMDSGVRTMYPTYKAPGEITYSCAVCEYTETEIVPMLENPPYLASKGMMHVSNNNNYMADLGLQPYQSGAGYVEFDFCPLSIEKYNGIPYVGVWFSNYGITACYNFSAQQVQIAGTHLPFGADATIYASADYAWTSDGGEFENNWKKFGVGISGTIVEIYIDGELVLTDTMPVYTTQNEVPLIYSNGECYFDNVKVVTGSYDLAAGSGGTVMGYWDFDSSASYNSFLSDWAPQLAVITHVNATAANVTTAHYIHNVHSGEFVGVIDSGCDHGGYGQYSCDSCGMIYFDDYTDPLYEDGHTLTDCTVTKIPTSLKDGEYSYNCKTCSLTFTEVIPKGTDIGVTTFILGDVTGDGMVSAADLSVLMRYFAGAFVEIAHDSADMNSDGVLTVVDITLLQNKLNNLG